jgi:hypothetical protein
MPENQNLNQPDQTENNKPAGSENVISDYYDDVKQLEMQGYESGIRKARNALFFAAGIYLVWELIGIAVADIPFSFIPMTYWLILGAVVGSFIGLAIWTRKRPYSAIIAGLILFILLWILSIVIAGGEAIYKGILVRAIVIVILIKALKPAKEWEDLKKNS